MSKILDTITRKEREKFREAQRYGRVNALVKEITALFCNAVTYTDLPENIPPEYITLGMLFDGAMCVRKDDTQVWYRVKPAGTINRYGYANYYNLGYANNVFVEQNVPYEDIHLIKANAECFPWFIKFVQSAERIERLETSAKINVEVSRNTAIIPVPDEKDVVSIENVFRSTKDGAVAVAVSDRVAEMLQNQITNPTAFVADKIMTLARAEWEDIIKRCGVLTSNNFKRERVQTAEVNAGAGECIDYIYILVDTFNRDCERAGLPTRAHFNGYASIYDTMEDNGNEGL